MEASTHHNDFSNKRKWQEKFSYQNKPKQRNFKKIKTETSEYNEDKRNICSGAEYSPMEVSTHHNDFSNKRKWQEKFSYQNKPKQRNFKKIKTEPSEYNEDKRNICSGAEVEPHKFTYFEKILPVLQTGLPDDSRDLFVINALKESEDEEVSLSCHFSSSRSIELLLSLCKDFEIWKKFMVAFAKDKETVYKHRNASHVLELLLLYSVRNIENWSSILKSDEDNEKKEQTQFLVSWIDEFGSFVLSNVIGCLSNPYASHIACSVISALGGYTTNLSDSMSKNSFNNKKDFSSKYIDTNSSSILFGTPVALKKIPKFFKETLKRIAEFVQQMEDVSEYIQEGYCAIFFETLITVLKQRLSNECYDEFINHFSAQLFSLKDNEGIPLAFTHKNSSFIVEKVFEISDESFQESLWNNYFSDNLHLLIVHHVSKFIIQKLFHTVQSESQLRTMIEKTGELFNEILRLKYYGIFINISEACLRLKAHQGLFIKLLMQCVQCSEVQNQLKIVPSLLRFEKYCGEDSELSFICLQGSLLVQRLLNFNKPIKIVKSLLSIKPQELLFLACHSQGCFVIRSFFNSSTVGEKSKDKFIQHIQPIITNLASDRNGSLTLARTWMLLTLKQKCVVADILLKNEKALKSNKSSTIIYNKFKLFLYAHKNEEWKKMQLELFSKKDVQNKDKI